MFDDELGNIEYEEVDVEEALEQSMRNRFQSMNPESFGSVSPDKELMRGGQ